jgi:hypothetical protein
MSRCVRSPPHGWVASVTGIGWRRSATKYVSGKSAWRNRIRMRFGGDFSRRYGFEVSQKRLHSS